MSNLQTIKGILATKEMQTRFADILGDKAGQYCASIINAVASNAKLQQCDAGSVMSAALIAATYDLPIDSNLGFAAIVPYGDKAQYQMMYKGFVQLAIRSGQYSKMGCSEVYEDEILQYNPIRGEVEFAENFADCTQRKSGDVSKIVGYYAYFVLKSGFDKELYMTRAEAQNHAKKYSKSYKYNSGLWTTDFDVMAKKTVLKLLLSKWGILSIDVQRAIQDDQMVYGVDGNGTYADNPADTATVTAPDPIIDIFAVDSEGVGDA